MLIPQRSPKPCLRLRQFRLINLLFPAILFTFWSLNLSGQTSGLVAAYNFNEGSGSTVTDLSGHNLNGTIVGATWTTRGQIRQRALVQWHVELCGFRKSRRSSVDRQHDAGSLGQGRGDPFE